MVNKNVGSEKWLLCVSVLRLVESSSVMNI